MLLRRPAVSGCQLERLIGHATRVILLNQPLLSIFRSLYEFIRSHYAYSTRLWASAAPEAEWAFSLLSFAQADLKIEPDRYVVCTDSSQAGYGVCETTYWNMSDIVDAGLSTARQNLVNMPLDKFWIPLWESAPSWNMLPQMHM